jgi:ribosomal protein S18 acetylase RimI-like enzyme
MVREPKIPLDVRRAGPSDAADACRALSALKPGTDPARIDERGMARWLRDPNRILILALDAAVPVGFALAYILERADGSGRMICFYEIEVAEARRRCGIGRRIVDALLETARGEAAYKMWVVADASNTPALALYAAAGAERSTDASVLFTWRFDAHGSDIMR